MAGCLDLLLKINGVDRTSLLIHETLSVTQTNDGLNSTCTFDLLDEAVIREDIWTVEETHVEDGDVITGYLTFFPQTKVDVCITNVAETLIYFAGILSRVHATHLGQIEIISGFVEPETQVLRCECADYNQVLEEMIIDDFREYGGLTDEELIDAVFDEFVAPFDDPYNIDYATFVTAVPHAFDIITFDSITVRQFMDTLCGITGAVWYVDYSRKLHYAADEADLVPPWHLSDVPDYVTSFAYFDDITKEKDATNLVNMVFVVCASDLLPVSLWFVNHDSVAKYGPHRAIVRDSSLFDIDDIEEKGNSILEKFSDPIVTYVLKTYKGTPGGNDGVHPATPIIRAGQHIRAVSAFYDLDETFLINNLIITFPVDGTPVFEITCGGLDSSASGSATRSTLDQIHVPNITPSQLPIASRGWGHDLEFTATDYRTVAWTLGTITTADGQEFNIVAGNTGNMAALTYVYLDTGFSITALRHSVNAIDAIGLGKILIAVCWPGLGPGDPGGPTDAGFQVFGGGAGTTLLLNADNVVAGSITANEIYGNSLEVIAANIGVLTMEVGGSIRMIGAAGSITITSTGIKLFDSNDPATGNVRLHLNTADGKLAFRSAVVGNPHIVIDNTEIAGYNGDDPAVLQFQLKAADGVAYAGAGKVWLDAGGLHLEQDEATAYVRFMDSGNLRAYIRSLTGVGVSDLLIFSGPAPGADTPRIELTAQTPAKPPASIVIVGETGATDGFIGLYPEGTVVAAAYPTYFQISGGKYLKVLEDARILKGLYVGGNVDPDDGDIWCTGEVSTDGGTQRWDLGAPQIGPPVPDYSIEIWINGVNYMISAEKV